MGKYPASGLVTIVTHKWKAEFAGQIIHENAGTLCYHIVQGQLCAILLPDRDPAPWPLFQVLTSDVMSLSLPFRAT
jgi:hypothetical protein